MEGLLTKYFVLKPKGEDRYARASRKAMRTYASDIESENPELAKSLRDWAEKESPEIPDTFMKNSEDAQTALGFKNFRVGI